MKLTEKIIKEKNLIDKNGHCTVPEGYTEIGHSAFWNCTSLKSMDLPNNITEIGDCAFINCTDLVSIIISNSVTKIRNNVFHNCTNLTSIKLPNNITEIGKHAFYNCTSLESIRLPDSVENLGDHSFYNCTSLKSINIPDSVKKIGDNVFSVCTSLPKLGVGKEILEIALKDNYFKQYRGLCFCFGEIVSELILKYRKPICLEVELPMFTVENAIKCANGTDGHYWFRDNSDRKIFLEWMLSEIGKRNINDEILILRR